jgi:putative transposase
LYGVCHETLNRWARREALNVPATPEVSSVLPAPPSATPALAPAPGAAAPGEPVKPKDNHKGYYPHWKEVLKVWRSRPGLGPAQIKNQLHRVGIKVTVVTVRKILEENGYTPPKATVKEVEINRYEAIRPLEIVHMDFKHFWINKAKVYLLLLQDDFSRFLCGHWMTDSENMKTVIEAFEECVNRYGKMQSVMTDAGSAFYSWNGINQFQKLMSDEYGVDQIKAGSPRSNGKIENVNKQIEKEVLDVKMYASLAEADTAIREWIRFYNFERTHMGLPPGTVPADRFLPGWNESGLPQPKNDAETKAEEKAWSEVLSFAQGKLKRAA